MGILYVWPTLFLRRFLSQSWESHAAIVGKRYPVWSRSAPRQILRTRGVLSLREVVRPRSYLAPLLGGPELRPHWSSRRRLTSALATSQETLRDGKRTYGEIFCRSKSLGTQIFSPPRSLRSTMMWPAEGYNAFRSHLDSGSISATWRPCAIRCLAHARGLYVLAFFQTQVSEDCSQTCS